MAWAKCSTLQRMQLQGCHSLTPWSTDFNFDRLPKSVPRNNQSGRQHKMYRETTRVGENRTAIDSSYWWYKHGSSSPCLTIHATKTECTKMSQMSHGYTKASHLCDMHDISCLVTHQLWHAGHFCGMPDPVMQRWCIWLVRKCELDSPGDV